MGGRGTSVGAELIIVCPIPEICNKSLPRLIDSIDCDELLLVDGGGKL